MLIFVGWVPPCLYPSGACLGLDTRVCRSLITPTRIAPSPGLRLCRGSVSLRAVAAVTDNVTRSRLRWRGHRLRFADRPHEAHELARDRGGDGIRVLAAREQPAVSPAQTHLRPPGDVADLFREILLARLDLFGHLGPVAIGLRGLDQGPPGMPVACLRDPAQPAPVTARVLTRGETEIAHQLPRGGEARQVSELRDRDDGHRELHAPQGLQRFDHRIEPPRL